MTISVKESMRSLVTHDGATATYSFEFQVETAAEVRVHVLVPDGVEEELTNPDDFTVTLAASIPGGSITLVSPATYPNLSVLRISRKLDATQPTTLANTGGHFPGEVERALDRTARLIQIASDRLGQSLSFDFTSEDAFDARTKRIKNLADPTENQDAATRSWVLSKILEAEVDGGNVSGLSALAATILVLNTADEWLDELSFSALGKTLAAVASAAAARTALGATTVGGNLFTAATGQAAMTAMGIAATVAAAFDNASSIPTLRDELGISSLVPYENGIINGDFKIWQTGTTRTGATAFPNNDATYFADQWKLLSDGNDQVDISANSTLGYPAGCFGSVDFEVVGAGKWGFLQFAESARSVGLRGKTVGVSFFAARTANLADFRVHLVSWSGTADAPTADIISAWGAATAKPTPVAGITLVDATAGSTFSVNLGTYTQHAFTFLVPNDANNVGLFVCTNDASYSAGDRVAFSGFSRSQALVATPYQSRNLAAELAECERFFCKTFELATVPASAAGLAGALMDIGRNTGSDPYISVSWQFRHRMLKAPAVLTYNPEAAGTAWEQVGGAQTISATVEAEGQSGCHIYGSAASSAAERYAIHATANARFF